MKTYRAHEDVSVLNDYLEVPGLGFLPVNAFVLHSAQPVVVDTGLGLADRDFVSDLAEVIDPSDVRWIWNTNPFVGPDQVALEAMLREFEPA